MSAITKILSLSSVIISFTGCATGLRCADPEEVVHKLRKPAIRTMRAYRYEAVYKYAATAIIYNDPEYVEIPMSGALCVIYIQNGKVVQASGCNNDLIGNFNLYHNACS